MILRLGGKKTSNKLWVVVFLCGSLCLGSSHLTAQTSGFPNGWGPIGPTKGEVVGIAVGAAAVIGLIVYLSIPKQKTIEGCVDYANSVKVLTNENDRHAYELVSDTVAVQPGHRLKLKGKKGKKVSGVRQFNVRKLVKDEGICR